MVRLKKGVLRKRQTKNHIYIPNLILLNYPSLVNLQKQRLIHNFKFYETLKQLRFDMPFLDDLTQIPTCSNFLKEMLSEKRRIDEVETTALTVKCSAMIKKKLCYKLKNHGHEF